MAAAVDVDQLEVVDVDVFLASPGSAEAKAECEKAARSLRTFGLLVVRDSRATEGENDGQVPALAIVSPASSPTRLHVCCSFLDMLERYFEQPDDALAADVRKELYYQVGTTPAFTELPRDHW